MQLNSTYNLTLTTTCHRPPLCYTVKRIHRYKSRPRTSHHIHSAILRTIILFFFYRIIDKFCLSYYAKNNIVKYIFKYARKGEGKGALTIILKRRDKRT